MGASKPAPGRSTSNFPEPLVLAAILLGALIVVYFPAIGGQFLWDDDAHVTAPALRSLPGLYRIWFDLGATQQYYPLLHTFFWIQHRLWGDWVSGYHLVGILLHAVNALLVYAVLRRLLITAPTAALAALVWALHPVMVESVAWITEQKNTLSGACYLGALYVWLKFDDSRRPRDYLLACALFLSALLCKTVTASLPAAILVVLWWKRGALSIRRDVLPLIPWFVLGAAAGLLTAWVETHVIGAHGSAYDLSLLSRSLLAGRIIWFYLGKLLWPWNLIFIYPRWIIDPGLWWHWIFPMGAVALVMALWIFRARLRGMLAGFLFFVGTLFPVLGFLNVYPFQFSYVADHFQYLASLGILVPVSVLATQLLPRLPAAGQRLGLTTSLALLAVLGLLTWSQTQRYRDMETLFGDVLKRNPGSWMAHVHMGTIRQSEGRVDEAMTHFQTATTINPDYFGAHINMGNIHMQDGRTLQAVEAYDRAVRLNPKDPLAHYSLGAALARLGRSDEAIDHYEQSLQLGIGPALESDARLGLGLALVSQNRPVEAIPQLESALAGRPVDPEAHCGLALLLLSQGESGKAAGHFEQAVQYRPDYPEALNGLAWIRATDANPANRSGALAVRLARRAVELTGGQNPYYLDTLAAAHAEAGSFPEALAAGERALELSRAGGLSDLEEQIQDHLSDYQANRKLSVPPVGDR